MISNACHPCEMLFQVRRTRERKTRHILVRRSGDRHNICESWSLPSSSSRWRCRASLGRSMQAVERVTIGLARPRKSVSRIGIGKVRFEVIMASGDLIILFAGLNSNDGPFMSIRVICCLVAQISITKLLRRFTSPFCAFHVHGEVLLDMMLTGHMLFPYLFSL